ncbi:hypothetical protein [Runella limosa]|uniref:hypothetical protein n=1 Tax=Runella limosa TaxID=370978 RepID=UPI0004000B85|nr:hypothetical protein [Runella limosa]
MKTPTVSLFYYLFLLFVCSCCTRSFTISGKVNAHRWYGAGQGNIIPPERLPNCDVQRFGFGATTDIPFDGTKTSKITGCSTNCHPKQHIDFYAIPLKEGKYDLMINDACLPTLASKARLIHFKSNPDGAHIIKGESVSVINDFETVGDSWLHITKYDTTNGQVKGKFELHLVNKKGDQLHFRKGRFNVKL